MNKSDVFRVSANIVLFRQCWVPERPSTSINMTKVDRAALEFGEINCLHRSQAHNRLVTIQRAYGSEVINSFLDSFSDVTEVWHSFSSFHPILDGWLAKKKLLPRSISFLLDVRVWQLLRCGTYSPLLFPTLTYDSFEYALVPVLLLLLVLD